MCGYVAGKTFSLVVQERVQAMKAVELEVSVISDCLSDTVAMVPKAEVEDHILDQCNSKAKRAESVSPRVSSVINNGNNERSPLRSCIAVTAQLNKNVKQSGFQNGVQKEHYGDMEKQVVQRCVLKSPTVTCQQSAVVCQENLRNGVVDKIESSYSSRNGSEDKSYLQNGVKKEESVLSSPRKDECNCINVLAATNGVVNGGYQKGDDEKFSLESLADVEVEGGSICKRSSSPPENIPRLQADSGLESAASSWDQAEARLRDELFHAREQLKLKDDEVLRLTRVRQEVESELEELTASLFQVRQFNCKEIKFTYNNVLQVLTL